MATNKRQSYNPQIDPNIDRRAIRHFQELYQSANDHDKAIIAVNDKVTALQSALKGTTTKVTSIISSSSSSSSSSTTGFLGLGYVNPQTATAAYTLQSSDSGIMIEVGNAAPVTITLNTSITSPFFCFITNFGPSTATLSATSPQTVNGGATYDILKNQLCMLVFFGSSWYASAFPIVPLNTPATPSQWLDSYDDTTGLFTASQPDFTDLAGTLQSGQLLEGVSASLGGSAMTAGQTISATVSILGATTAMVAVVSPATYPGDGFVWDSYVSATDTVTVRLTATLAGTPTASTYNVRCLA